MRRQLELLATHGTMVRSPAEASERRRPGDLTGCGLAGQTPNECLIRRSIAMAASVYRPPLILITSDAKQRKAAITKPLNIVELHGKDRQPG